MNFEMTRAGICIFPIAVLLMGLKLPSIQSGTHLRPDWEAGKE
jgi:hypothetical protein